MICHEQMDALHDNVYLNPLNPNLYLGYGTPTRVILM